jgi:hypothetical protein
MKTHYFVKDLVLYVFVSLSIISCTKESDTVSPVNIPSDKQATSALIGNLVDFGSVSADTRLMRLYDSVGEISQTSARIELSFYVNEDGSIPAGEYTYSSSVDKTPYTFDTGVFMSTSGTQSDQIVNGSIFVNRSAANYVFTFQAGLASGMTFSQRYDGSISYTDSK